MRNINISKERAMTVIKKPLLTEKSFLHESCYVFVVDRNANKYEISAAVRVLFNVEVDSVRTVNYKSEKMTFRNKVGYKSAYKKAIVKLSKFKQINFAKLFE